MIDSHPRYQLVLLYMRRQIQSITEENIELTEEKNWLLTSTYQSNTNGMDEYTEDETELMRST